MSLRQQIKKLTRSIRQQKEQRQRLRQALQKETRDQGREQVEALRQKLKPQDPSELMGACAELVQTYVRKVLGRDSFVSGNGRDPGMYIRWSQFIKEEDRLQHHCVYVEPGGRAVKLYLDCMGHLAGGGDRFHVANDPVKDWPL